MRRTTLAAVVVAAILAPTIARPAVAGVPIPAPDATGMIKAIVVLKSQLDPSTVRGPSRRQRQVALVRALRGRAAADQRGILDLLSTRRAQGSVAASTPLWVFNAVAVVARPSVIQEIARRPEVRAVRPDQTVQAPPSMAVSAVAGGPAVEANVGAVNAPALWSLGLTGQGTVVATMDTGVDGSHPDLAANWRGGGNSWYDPNGEHPSFPTDVNGHGTSSMGVIVGGSAGGTAIGVAPGAKWIAVKIFNDRGTTSTSRIHQGFQWLLDPDGNPSTADAPDVVNNSWSGATGGCNLDFQPDLRNLRAAGILPVFSAGNYGPTAATVLSPANNPEAFAVGGIDDASVLDPASSRGPSACGQLIEPRVVAPGVGVRTTDLYGGYLDASGTSLAAPHVAGTLALLLGAYPNLSAEQQAAALESTAVDLGAAGPDNAYGYGRLDALAAYQSLSTAPDFAVTASPAEMTTVPGGGVSFDVSVAGVNGFAGDVALALGGLSGTQANWTIGPAVIPGGTGNAHVSVTTSTAITPGTYPLTVNAVSGDLSRTATVRLTVTAPADFALAATPSSRAAVAGTSAVYTVTITGVNGFAGTVTTSLGGLPGSVGTASFSPPAVVGSATSTLTISTSASAPLGTYPLTVTATSGSTSHSTAITLVVTPRPDFAMTAAPATIAVLRHQTATYTVSTSASGGFAGVIALSITGAPAGSQVSFTPNPVAASGTSTMRVTTTGQTPRGTFTLRISGISGSLVHQAQATLVIR